MWLLDGFFKSSYLNIKNLNLNVNILVFVGYDKT
jgi:hypothetical protein